MGEQPIFSTKAHVFHIDPSTKKNWIPSSSGSINVSFYYDSTRGTYRIISVDGSKAVINSTLTHNMSFTKTSQKFGQWSDPRASTVYGLGFPTEAELNKFAEKFDEVRDLTKMQSGPGGPLPKTAAISSGGMYLPDTLPSSTPLPPQQQQLPLSSLHHNQPPMPPYTNGEQESLVRASVGGMMNVNQNQRSSSSSAGSGGPVPPAPLGVSAAGDPSSQLKYENDRLKLALAQSSTNGKKWEAELQTLKNNNARLTTALQESSSNLEEWKKQLAAYKEENARLKKKTAELEKAQAGMATNASVQQELSSVMGKLEIVEGQRNRSEENSQAYKAQLERVQQEKKNTDEQHQTMEIENRRLKNDLDIRTAELQQSRSQEGQYSTTVRSAKEQLEGKITDLQSIHSMLQRLQP